ncbi:MAG: hypothetical protein DI535_19000 [Citrobacter freundii]|nr:MAG: hypothetical protein DI535_19000 [Citrobacter freundii]
MRKVVLIALIATSSVSSFSQKKVELTKNSITATYDIQEENACFVEKIQVKNHSNQAIYIPDIKNRDLYFFVSKQTLFSHLGIMFSILGTPDLSLEVRLIKLLPNEQMDFFIKLPNSNNNIKRYHFSFDFIKETKLVKQRGDEMIMAMPDYVAICKQDSREID